MSTHLEESIKTATGTKVKHRWTQEELFLVEAAAYKVAHKGWSQYAAIKALMDGQMFPYCRSWEAIRTKLKEALRCRRLKSS